MRFKVKNFVIVSVFILIILFFAGMIISSIFYEMSLNEYKRDYNSLQYHNIDIESEYANPGIDIDNYIDINDYSGKTDGFDRQNGNFNLFNNLDDEKYRYYIDNRMIDAGEDDEKNHCYLVKGKSDRFDFCYKLTENYRSSYWYIKKDYIIPSVITDPVKSVMIVAKDSIVSTNIMQIPRINTDNCITITDKAVIENCVNAYKKGKAEFDFLKSEGDAVLVGEYIVLAVFDNDTIYQFLGNL